MPAQDRIYPKRAMLARVGQLTELNLQGLDFGILVGYGSLMFLLDLCPSKL